MWVIAFLWREKGERKIKEKKNNITLSLVKNGCEKNSKYVGKNVHNVGKSGWKIFLWYEIEWLRNDLRNKKEKGKRKKEFDVEWQQQDETRLQLICC